MRKINLVEKFAAIDEHWSPKVVTELNGQQVRLAKLKGTFVWHKHADEDELFLVISGRLRIEFRDGDVTLDPGEMIVVPRGVEHRPHADAEVEVMLFEPAATINTGDVREARTLHELERI
jgi:mannose-6-phosphate isomerase-like protein (cupin superfamily)